MTVYINRVIIIFICNDQNSILKYLHVILILNTMFFPYVGDNAKLMTYFRTLCLYI